MWLMQVVNDTNVAVHDPEEGVMFMASLFSGKGHTVCISLVGDDYSPTQIEFYEEIYNTHFWAEDPTSMFMSITAAFLQQRDKYNPVELVYAYGGTVRSQTITIATPEILH